jgi:hypothetical protein
MVRRVQVRTITNDEGNKLLRVVPRGSGSMVTCGGRGWSCRRRRAGTWPGIATVT